MKSTFLKKSQTLKPQKTKGGGLGAKKKSEKTENEDDWPFEGREQGFSKKRVEARKLDLDKKIRSMKTKMNPEKKDSNQRIIDIPDNFNLMEDMLGS